MAEARGFSEELMTDEEYANAVSRVDALADEWLPLLGMKEVWHVTLKMYRDSGDYAESDRGERLAVGDVSIAHTRALWPYLQATIHVNMPQFALHDRDEQEEIFVHEACHILVREMRDACGCACNAYIISHEERVCTMLSHAFLLTKYRALPANEEDGNHAS